MKSAFILLCFFMLTIRGTADIVINEFMASNSDYYQDPDEPGEYPDWIELYNTSGQAVNIGGWYLTDNAARPSKWQIAANTEIPANGYLFFMADSDPEQGPMHTSFKLDVDGGFVGLVQSDLTFVDSLSYAKQFSDVSYGRSPDGAGDWYFFDNPTANTRNGTDGFLGEVDKVRFSHQHGFYDFNFKLTLSVAHPTAQIYYTLDGSEPVNRVTSSSRLYTDLIDISITTHVRARAFADGCK